MSTVEFTTELNGGQSLAVPADAANKLPKSGKAKVVLTGDDDDEEWRRGAYEAYMRDDNVPEDSVYDRNCKPATSPHQLRHQNNE